MLGQLNDRGLRLQELHRFGNGPVALPGGLHWDVLRLWGEIRQGIALAARDHELAGIGLDAWGVDFALLDRRGELIGNPYHYRDGRTDGMMEETLRRLPRQRIFDLTGIQFMQINTLYQLLALVTQQAPALEIAATFLTIPDLFNYWLAGVKVCEFSNATTTQCYDPRQRGWAEPLLAALDIPTHIFPEIVPSGTVLGPLLGLERGQGGGAPVIAPACHDTGSAVVAVPATGDGFAWISSGTWSVMGAETSQAVITPQSLTYNFTNEGGAGGGFRLSKNIMGLWLLQECRRTWAAQGQEYSYDDLVRLAAAAPPFQCVIDPDHGEFLKPGDMPRRIRAFAVQTGQPAPENTGAVVRCVLEGIALKYRFVLERLQALLGRRLQPIHIVGGGAQNRLLSQFTADATGRVVLAGPTEATATGNVLVQALALAHIESLAAARALVRQSADISIYEPGAQAGWDEAYQRLLALTGEGENESEA